MNRAISIIGQCSNVGKTTLIKNLLKIFTEKNLKVGVIKHHHREFDFDKPGKDSHIFTESGAKTVKLISPNRVITVENNGYERDLYSVIDEITYCDFVLVEGYKWEKLKKIEIFRTGYSDKIITEDEDLLAIVSDVVLDTHKKQFNYLDYEGISDFIIDYFEKNK